ncbi:LOW QUALITY PROTEIN: mannitol-1-phosphate 5-dehydrogenase [Geomicrobium sp. JCM 19039]|nr:LOW QUALITY PROTEIN: mannitol-1-phosphate 5-dehydrogenase [Geomicrobium sp. JCM 19039]
MQAVHFGAGNIGRGFIGAVLSDAGYRVTFVDVNHEVISALKERGSYTVRIASAVDQSFDVQGVTAERDEQEQVIEAIANAQIITTAVGPTVLPHIAPLIAKGLGQRDGHTPVNIIACENAIRATSTLKGHVVEHLSEGERRTLAGTVGFLDAAVDRIVPNVQQKDALAVTVEPFFEWVVEDRALVGDDVELGEALLVPDLDSYIDRKLFTVNTGHAVAAYAGFHAGKERILDALQVEAIESHVRAALHETAQVLVEDYGFEKEAHMQYVERIIERFKNPFLEDTVARVGRGPIRKLGSNDRLVKPARFLAEKGEVPHRLIASICQALFFRAEGDAESEELEQLVQQYGAYETFLHVSGLDGEHPLAALVKKRLEQEK